MSFLNYTRLIAFAIVAKQTNPIRIAWSNHRDQCHFLVIDSCLNANELSWNIMIWQVFLIV